MRIEEVQAAYENAIRNRSYVGFCIDCGSMREVDINPEIVDGLYATEMSGWIARMSKLKHNNIDYELIADIVSEAEFVIDEDGRWKPEPPNTSIQFWSRKIVAAVMKDGQRFATCPHCKLGVDLLLHDDDYVTTANGGRIDVKIGRFRASE